MPAKTFEKVFKLSFMKCKSLAHHRDGHFNLGHGVWPTHDWEGIAFSEEHHPHWFALGGSLLAGGWRGVLDGIQGDQDWLHKVFSFKRTLDTERGAVHVFSV